jgi:hypothetical protein
MAGAQNERQIPEAQLQARAAVTPMLPRRKASGVSGLVLRAGAAAHRDLMYKEGGTIETVVEF